jgi:hypothetical protein
MKNKLLGLLFSLLLILGVAQSAHAFPLQNWVFDIEGGSGATTIIEFMNIESPNFVDTTTPVNGSFNFVNWGFVESSGHDNLGSTIGYPGSKSLTGKYRLPGDGTLGGEVNFNNTGTFELWVDAVLDYGTATSTPGAPPTGPFYGSDNGTLIATFDVISGSGELNSTGLPNGDFSISYQATYLRPGYFFMPDGTTDMSGFTDLVRGYTTTNASHFSDAPDGSPVPVSHSELLAYADYSGTPANTPPDDFFLSSSGQFRIDVVPVPPAMILLGSGLAALVGIRRKNS